MTVVTVVVVVEVVSTNTIPSSPQNGHHDFELLTLFVIVLIS